MVIGAILQVNAQKEFNKLSIEINGGFNKPMGPLSPGYYSPTLNIGHFDFGGRYMFNEYFGVKLDYGTGKFNEAKDVSPEFETNYFRANIQGVANFGKVLNFRSLYQGLGLLGHFGGGFGRMDYKNTILNQERDRYYTILVGITPQLKLSNKVALTGDITYLHNGRQTYTFDGNKYNAPVQPNPPSNPLIHAVGGWWTGTIGLNFYIGKFDQHADWYSGEDKYATKAELEEAVTGIKDMLKDSDGDGVPDYLDKEPNTPAGARVSTHGVTLDSDQDGTADHLDKCPFVPGPSSTNGCPIENVKEEVDYLKKAINDGYVNVFFAFDSSKPLAFSISSINYVSNFLKRNPGVKIEIKGYADELGQENYNIKLSEKRARAVHEILLASGIDSSRLSFKGYGEDTSVDKSSPDARQMARRTSFEVK